MNDVWSCDDCGSRRISGSPDEGVFCHDCGRSARGQAEVEDAFGGGEEADGGRRTAPEGGAWGFVRGDTRGHLRCAACFRLASRCARATGSGAARCCVACRCAGHLQAHWEGGVREGGWGR